MTTTDVSATGSEAPVIPAVAAAEGSVTETAAQRRERAMALAATMEVPGAPGVDTLSDDEAAKALEAAKAAAADPMGAAAAAAATEETAEQREARLGALSADDRAAEEQKEADAAALAAGGGEAAATGEEAPAFTVEIPVAGSEAPFVLDVSDEETATHINDLIKRAVRGDQSRAIREQAQRMLDEADEFHYVVELDPAGVVTETIKKPEDVEHLFRYLATRPGVLEKNADWIGKLMDGTESVATQGDLAELERMRRKDAVAAEVNAQRESRQYDRALASAIFKSIESLAPDAFSEKGRDLLYDDVMKDARRFQKEHDLRTMDLRRVPGFIQSRFASMGIQPKGANQGSDTPKTPARPAAPAAVVPAKTGVAPSPKTAADLKAASATRQAAASAPAGPGGVAQTLPTPPAFDPKVPGNPIQQRVAWAKKFLLPSLAKKPQ